MTKERIYNFARGERKLAQQERQSTWLLLCVNERSRSKMLREFMVTGSQRESDGNKETDEKTISVVYREWREVM